MACSPECFQEYMNRIEEARKPITEVNIKIENEEIANISKIKKPKKKPTELGEVSENIIIEN